MALPITVSGPRTDGSERNVGKNTIVVAMTRSDAGFPRDVLRHYAKTNRAASKWQDRHVSAGPHAEHRHPSGNAHG